MINARKGNAHSLAQTDFTGSLKTDEGVIAGQLVRKNATGQIEKVPASGTSALTEVSLVGFAVTNQNEGDAIESKKIGVYALDGGSVIETDQFEGTVVAADVGKYVVQGVAAGKVKVVATVTTEVVLGKVYDAPRSIFVGQTPVTVLPIKLKA